MNCSNSSPNEGEMTQQKNEEVPMRMPVAIQRWRPGPLVSIDARNCDDYRETSTQHTEGRSAFTDVRVHTFNTLELLG